MTTVEGRPFHRVLLSAGLPRENRLPKLAVGRGLGAIDISGLVKRVRTVETIGQPNATFEMGLTFQSLAEAIPVLTEKRAMNLLAVPQNLCEIYLGGEPPPESWDITYGGSGGILRGREPTSVLQGVITRVYERTALNEDGEPNREVVLAGESYGGILAKHEIPAHVFSTRFQSEKELAQLIELNIMLDGPCGLIEQKLYDRIFTQQTNPLQLKTRQVFAFDIDQSLFSAESGVTFQGNAWQRQGTLWTLMRSLADEPWNELFATWNPNYIPQGPGDGLTQQLPSIEQPGERKFVIRLRRRPFDKARWENLPTHTCMDDEIRYQEWALADDERLNWIAIETPTTLAAGEVHAGFLQFMYARFDLDDAEAHGARLRRFPTQYNDRKRGAGTLLTDPHEHERFAQGEGEAAEIANDRVQAVWNWYNINHRLYRGTVVLRGRPEIHVGTRFAHQRTPSSYFVKEECERRVAYIETVVQDYLDGHHYWTHLALTRGQPIDGFIVPWVDGKRRQRGGGPESTDTPPSEPTPSEPPAPDPWEITPQGGGAEPMTPIPLLEVGSIRQQGLGVEEPQRDDTTAMVGLYSAVVTAVYPVEHPENTLGQTVVDLEFNHLLPPWRKVPLGAAYAHGETEPAVANSRRRLPFKPKQRNQMEGNTRDIRPGTRVLVQFPSGDLRAPIVVACLKFNLQGDQPFPTEKVTVDRFNDSGHFTTATVRPVDAEMGEFPRARDTYNGSTIERDNRCNTVIQASIDKEPVWKDHNGIHHTQPPQGNILFSTRGAGVAVERGGRIGRLTGKHPLTGEKHDGTFRDETKEALRGSWIVWLQSKIGRLWFSTKKSDEGHVYIENGGKGGHSDDRSYLSLKDDKASLHAAKQAFLDAAEVCLGNADPQYHAVLWEPLNQFIEFVIMTYDMHTHGGVNEGEDDTLQPNQILTLQWLGTYKAGDAYKSDHVKLVKDEGAQPTFEDDPDGVDGGGGGSGKPVGI